jgi:serpin B
MAIVYEGARGDTAREIQSVFHFPAQISNLRQGYKDILSDPGRDSQGDIFLIANGLWAEKSYTFIPGYIQTAQQYYSAKVSNLDFINNPEDSRLTINRWVETNTKDRIQNLIPVGKITPLTRLVSTNAMYFSGSWEQPFDKGLTKEENFFIKGNESVRVKMMHIRDSYSKAKFNYMDTENASDNIIMMSDFQAHKYRFVNASSDSFQMIELPYKRASGKELSMLVILPLGENITAFEKSLTLAKLVESKKRLRLRDIHVSMPKFRFETWYDLPETLKVMGMPTAFNASADFSGMDGTKTLFLSFVLHKAFIDVNEEGTIAAAASATGVTQGIEPYFFANHPFIFIIQERETGNIIFMGRILNPNN